MAAGVVLASSHHAVAAMTRFMPFDQVEVAAMGAAFVALTAYYVAARTALHAYLARRGEAAHAERARSWLLSLAVAVVTTVGGIPPLVSIVSDCLWHQRYTVLVWTDMDDSDARAFYPRPLAQFFLVFCVADLVIGTLDYPAQLAVATGWIHHTVYIALVVWLSNVRTCTGLLLFGVCEAPTLVLAVGTMFKRLRSDWTFGVLFFVTRVAYFAFVWYHLLLHGTWPRALATTALLGLHCTWFIQWAAGMLRRWRASGRKEA